MRPVRLVAQGFTAFRDLVEVDFEGVDFFALVGPTGSGKSSVIDAMCFALYGSVPRYEDEKRVAPAITMGASEARVSLTFDVAGRRYIATRVVRRQRKGGATTKEARLERVTDQSSDILAGTADEVTKEVERLLGLVFKHFTRCVVLPQGEFARFLHDRPAERQQLLVSLLDIELYDRMGQRARRIAEVTKNEVAGLQSELGKLAFATPDAEIAVKERLTTLGQLRSELAVGASAIAALEAQLREQRVAETSAATFAGLLTAIEVPSRVIKAAAALRELDAAVAGADQQMKETERARKEIEKAVEELPDKAELAAAKLAHEEVAKLDRQIADSLEGLAAAASKSDNCAALLDSATATTVEAAEALDALRRQHSAVDLAVHLAVGEACPVCLQKVAAIPKHRRPSALADAERATRRAEGERSAAEKELATAQGAVERARSRSETLGGQKEGAAARTESHPDVGDLAALLNEVELRTGELATARDEEQQARDGYETSRRLAGDVRAALAGAWGVFDAQRDPVTSLRPPKLERHDLLADWTSLADWATEESERQASAAATAREAASRCAETLEVKLDELRGRCTEEGVALSRSADLDVMRDAAVGAIRDAEHVLAGIVVGSASAARLRDEVAELGERAAVADLLGANLRSTGFQRWLVSEALDLLVEGASETLRRLSGGQYSLDRDDHNEFVVIDHRNADERRSAKTLSGGETFQASLALALALADQLAGLSSEGAPKLESFFLDEGFGTLDPETLAAVADTIESLGSDERMVGVVTHVRELAERIPVRFEVTKGIRTSSVERRLA